MKALLTDPEVFGTTLFLIAADIYGMEIVQWHPLTLRTELEEDFDVELSKANFDKLMGVVAYMQSNEFFVRVPVFIQICNALAGGGFNPLVFDPADAHECAWAMTEVMLLNPPEEDEPFSEEVRRYIGTTLDWEGILEAPDILKVAIRDTTTGKPDYSSLDPDNPDMFQADYELQKGRTEEISTMLRNNLAELLGQLGQLRLNNGDTADIVKKAREALNL